MILPTVAIVIPTRNRTGFLKRCLSKLLPYVSSHPECSITVSDDGDASVTREALGGEMGIVQVIQGPRRGPAANRNCGAAHSTGDLLVFLDDDCIPEENLIEIYQDAARKSPGSGSLKGASAAQRENPRDLRMAALETKPAAISGRATLPSAGRYFRPHPWIR